MRQLPEREPQPDFEIERAITFLVKQIQESGHNPKPVIFHSLRVGVYLFNCVYPPPIVIAGILHDLIEDSDTTLAEINDVFGTTVTELVRVNTVNPAIDNRAEQGRDRIQRCADYGKEALVVMAADMLDNSHYLDPRLDESFARFWVAEKMYFLEVSHSTLSNEKVWLELYDQCQKLQAALQRRLF